MPVSRWHQDIEVAQLIEHLDQPERYGNWGALTPSEVATILKELDRCRQDFVYAARNYFWISNKKLGDQLFSLWPSQELILEKILELKAKGKPQKLVCIKARQLGALDPETPVLTADLRWVPIDSLNVGDSLVSVDEFPCGGVGRRLREAQVLNKWEVEKEAFRLTLSNGKTITATGDHPFLCKMRGGSSTAWVTVKQQNKHKKSRSPIVPGDEIRYIAGTWEDSRTFEDGWFSGLLDGEGCLRAKHNAGVELCVVQVDGPVLRRAISYLTQGEYSFRTEVDNRKGGESSKFGNKPVYKLVINRLSEVFRLLGKTRPSRFIDRRPWEGKDTPNNGAGESWIKVVSVESLGVRRMVDIETTTKTFIANGLVTHNCSTLIEALICWRTVFFSNVNALVVSKDINHAAYALWPIMQFIYDRLPWWLQPMTSMRKAEEGMIFENPVYDDRRMNPGLNSRIYVKGAKSGGVGQGIRLSAVHFSEFADTDDWIAKEIIDEDMVNALVEDQNTFAILESTAKGANRYAHKLWKRCVELGDEAEWCPIFLPWFFEADRVRPVIGGFRIEPEDSHMRDRVLSEWARCDNADCLQYHVRFLRGEDRSETTCVTCQTGTVHPYQLTDQQLNWMQHRRHNAKRDDDSMKKLLQEVCTTGEEAFQVSGYQIFGQQAQDFANSCVRPPIAYGDFDNKGRLHGCNTKAVKVNGAHGSYFPCFQQDCPLDHTYDENPLQIWEFPQPNAEYCVGADVAEGGGGKADYSVGAVTKYNTPMGCPNSQVAVWTSNRIDPIAFAGKLNWLGLWYNSALMAVEVNKFDICLGTLRINLNYPNLYRWKHIDSVNILSNKWGWETNLKSRPRLWQTMKSWLRQELFVPRSSAFAEQMKNFVKDDVYDSTAGADGEEHDDILMATMISLFCANEGLWNDALGMAVPREELTLENARFCIRCSSCGHEWPENKLEDKAINPDEFVPEIDSYGSITRSPGTRCPACGSRNVSISRNTGPLITARTDADMVLSQLGSGGWSPDMAFAKAEIPSYDML